MQAIFISSPFFIILASAGFAFFASWLLVHFLHRIYKAQKQGADDEIIVTETSEGLMKSFLPMARVIGRSLRGIFHGDNNSTFYFRFSDGIERTLVAAGRPEGLIADEFIGFGILYGMLFTTLVMTGVFMLSPETVTSFAGLYFAFIIFIFGTLLWKSWLTNKLRLRQTSIVRQLPFALDLLTLAMEAGLDFTSALSRIVGKIGKSPLGQELSLMLHEIQLGKTRSNALRDFAERCDVQEVRTVVASLIQAEELGSSLGVVLRIQAAQQREKRSQIAEEKAMKAPVKMLFPMIFILGAIVVIIGAPIFLMWKG